MLTLDATKFPKEMSSFDSSIETYLSNIHFGHFATQIPCCGGCGFSKTSAANGGGKWFSPRFSVASWRSSSEDC
jgi:hypothetical protein